MRYVIIGNGVAGVCGAEAIREYDSQGSIAMIGDESSPPYCRPMISMVLEGSAQVDKIPIRSERFYDDLNVTPILGKRVTAIDIAEKAVILPGNSANSPEKIAFDKLLIASGADPRPIKAEGCDLENIYFMRTQSQVISMLRSLPRIRNALVLGGGLVGFKAAYALLKKGINVVMLIRSAFPLSMQVDETAGKIILDRLVDNGLDVRLGVEVTSFSGNGKVQAATLSDGSELPCDLVIIGKGVLPALDFVPRDRIEVDLGIVVGKHLETSTRDIYAAGDVAEYIDIARQKRWVNAIWPEAVTQGRIAGTNMAGRPLSYKGSLSRNVMRIFDVDVLTGGIVNPSPGDIHNYEIVSAHGGNCYRKLLFQEDLLVGAVIVNDIEQGGVLLSLIRGQTPISIPRKRLLSRSFNYRQLIT